jgi:nitronate monooxygenase
VNAQQIKAALDVGADGVSMGTLFITSKECMTEQAYRDRISTYHPDKSTVVTKNFAGRPARVIPNKFYREISAICEKLGGEHAILW